MSGYSNNEAVMGVGKGYWGVWSGDRLSGLVGLRFGGAIDTHITGFGMSFYIIS